MLFVNGLMILSIWFQYWFIYFYSLTVRVLSPVLNPPLEEPSHVIMKKSLIPNQKHFSQEPIFCTTPWSRPWTLPPPLDVVCLLSIDFPRKITIFCSSQDVFWSSFSRSCLIKEQRFLLCFHFEEGLLECYLRFTANF